MSPEKEQVTVMILYVDLKCPCCYKKVRKLLCKFPQIRDQMFDEEKNKVTITVVCCDPERLRDKLCCKGGKAIQSIEILDPPKPPPPKPKPPPAAPKPAADPPPKPKPDPPQPKVPDNPKPPPQPKPDPPQPKVPDPKPPSQPKLPDPPQPKVPDPKPPPQPEKPDPPQPKLPNPPQPEPVPIAMDPCWPPVSACCQECYEGRGGGPCYYGYGRPVPPPPGPCYGRPVPPPPGPCYDGYGYGYRSPCYVTRCDYFSEENPQGCSIM